MSARDWAVLAFRLLGLWFAANGVIGLANLPYMWEFGDSDGVWRMATLAMVFPSLLTVIVGGLIWLNTATLATRACGEDPTHLAARVFGDGEADPRSRDTRLEAQPLFALALSVIGILLVVEAVPTIVYALTTFVYSRRTGTAIFGPDLTQQALIWNAAAKSNAAAACTRLLIGLVLLAGPARLSALYARTRAELRGTLGDDDADASKAGTPTVDAGAEDGLPR